MDYNFLFYLSVCFLLSFFIGFERQYRKRIIGLRTTILVSLGAFLFVRFSFSVGGDDISRIASQVVAGIGFLGAGVILKDGKKIRGLTTAATLWCDAAIGVLCAGGAIPEAIVGTIIILFSNVILRYVNKLINNLSDNKNLKINYQLTITSTNKEIKLLKEEIKNLLTSLNGEILNTNLKNNLKQTTLIISFIIYKKNNNQLDQLTNLILENDKIQNIELKKVNEIKPEDFDDEL